MRYLLNLKGEKMNLILENPNEKALKAFKAMAKALNVRVKTQKPKTKGGILKEALKEAERIKANPHLYKGYKSAKDMIEDCLK